MKVYILFKNYDYESQSYLSVKGVYKDEKDAINDRDAFGIDEHSVFEFKVIE